jgi:hypothetical protein
LQAPPFWASGGEFTEVFSAEAIMAPVAKQLSGPAWVARFPDAGGTDALAPGFRSGCEKFISAMRNAGADVHISSTRRPAERAYLMHYCWRIHKGTLSPKNVPGKTGVNIEWVHRKTGGSIDLPASGQAAAAMVQGYDIAFQPALDSRHVQGRAIDMSIDWNGTLRVVDEDGATVEISSAPRNGFNLALRRVGKSYGVIKHPSDPPHWSTDGR